ncbi:MAG: GGDEF domain-containing protein [Burkholderiaceae bacterium]|nr:GGDEF domain-containing protein [Burkholderiaceae bacterium]
MILDIDHFKTINDSHGHAVGDQVLHQIADVLRNAVRESDFVARIGGEEFLVLLPATGLNEARMVAEKIRLAVELTKSPTGEAITISIGVAIASPDDRDEDVCVVKADNMLYEAKRAGRNRVMCFGT